jgi:hypothetical protein
MKEQILSALRKQLKYYVQSQLDADSYSLGAITATEQAIQIVEDADEE